MPTYTVSWSRIDYGMTTIEAASYEEAEALFWEQLNEGDVWLEDDITDGDFNIADIEEEE